MAILDALKQLEIKNQVAKDPNLQAMIQKIRDIFQRRTRTEEKKQENNANTS